MSELTTRDYKGAGRRPGPPPGGLKEFLLGALAGGLLAGVGTALVMHHAQKAAAAACAATGAAAPAAAPAAASGAQRPGSSRRSATMSAPSARPGAGRQVASASKPAPNSSSGAPHGAPSAAKSQPKYDFYQMLPNLKVTVPPPTAPGARSVGPNGHAEFAGYVLQVGAYSDQGQARRVVAYLDSIGILAHIDTVRQGGTTLYRVRIGPIIERSELNRFEGVLKRIGYPGVLIPGATR